MAKPKRKKKDPKLTTAEWAALNTDDVMRKVFGKEGQKTLQREAAEKSPAPKKPA